MCVQVRREYDIATLDADRAARFAAAALLNVLPPTDWQISSDVELVVGQYMSALRDRLGSGTGWVEVSVHDSFVELSVDAEDPRWIEERVRLRPRRPFTGSLDCDLPEVRPTPLPKPALWPALAQPQGEASWGEWRATWDALHEVTQSIRLGDGDLGVTLDAIAAGVVRASCFTVAAVNLVMPDGDFQVVSVSGSDEARQALLGVVEPAARWMALIEHGVAWGSLCYTPYDETSSLYDEMTSWAASEHAHDDPDVWHPLDGLFAPLYSRRSTCIGALSVDLPPGSQRPRAADLARLEVFADHAATAIERAQTGRNW